ncbi:unnamed protein product [Closterium sp. NIES-53]
MQAKFTRYPFSSSEATAKAPLDEVVMDVVGPLKLGTAGAEYFLTIVDVYTRMTWEYVLSKKSDVAETVKTDWLPMGERQQDRLVKAIRTDRGGEFLSKEFSLWLKKNGIRHSLTMPYAPAMNGIAERANRTITETARGLLIEAGLPDYFWPDAVRSACVAKNRALTHLGADKWVPYVEWIERKPKVDMLRVFGRMCMALVPKHLRHNKLGAKEIWAVHLGMAQNSKGWLLWDPFTEKFLVSRDCKFMENLMYKDWKAENEAKIGMRFGEVKSSGLEHQRLGLHVSAAEEEGRGKRRIQDPNRLTYDSLGKPAKSALAGAALMVGKDEESDYEECAFAFFSPVEMPGEPATLKEAFESSDAEEWKKAKGYQQKEKVDYKELFAPVVKPTTLRTLLAGAAMKGWVVKQMDVTTAFLNGVLEEAIFMAQPEGTSGMGLVLGGRARVVLTGHADASWVETWLRSGRHRVTPSVLAPELRWLTYLLTNLGEAPRSPPVLYVDNKAMLALCLEHRLEHRTKHIALRYFLVRELQQRGQLRLAYVASQANIADVFTKALQPLDKLSPRAIPCIFLGFVPDTPGWPFYHPTSHRVFSSQAVTFDGLVPLYRLFPYRSALPPPPPLFLAPGPPLVDPLPPQGPAPSGVSQVDPLHGPVPVHVAVDSGAARGAVTGGAASRGAEPRGAESEGAETGGAEPGGVATGGGEPGGAEPEGVEPGGATSEGAESGGAEPQGAALSRGSASASPRLSLQQLSEWFVRRTRLRSGASGARGAGAAGAGGTGVAAGAGVTGVGGPGVGGVLGPTPSVVSQVDPLPGLAPVQVAVGSGAPRGAASGGAAPGGAQSEGAETRGAEPGGVATGGGEPGGAEPEGFEPGGAASEGAESGGAEPQGAASSGGAGGAGPAGVGGPGVAFGAGVTGGTATTSPGGACTRGTGAAGTGGVEGTGAGDLTQCGTPGVGGAGVGGPGVGQVLGTSPSAALTPPLVCPPPDQSQPPLQPSSPLPAPSPYTEDKGYNPIRATPL